MSEIKINPYNFVPLGCSPSRGAYAKRHVYDKNSYNGRLTCELTVKSPLITVDQRRYDQHKLTNKNGTPITKKDYGRTVELNPIKVFRFLKNSRGDVMIQGTSLKGLIRSVYEALTNSCMCLAATSSNKKKNTYKYDPLTDHDKKQCNGAGNLCPACMLFGTVGDEDVHFQGKTTFEDAKLCHGELTEKRYYLKELSSPKPRHCATYGKNRVAGQIGGRKFYYHQGDTNNFHVTDQTKSNDRSVAIEEYAPAETQFIFDVHFENLTKEELEVLLLSIELEPGLGHKLGLGKAVGMGSCIISVDKNKSEVYKAASRYQKLGDVSTEELPEKKRLCALPISKTEKKCLHEVLRLNKHTDNGKIGYLWPYPKDPIDEFGVFGGRKKTGPVNVGPKANPLRKPSAPVPKRAASVQKGQTLTGVLKRINDQWTALFEGDKREAIIVNPSKIPIPQKEREKRSAEFYIMEQSKKNGIKARFEKLV